MKKCLSTCNRDNNCSHSIIRYYVSKHCNDTLLETFLLILTFPNMYVVLIIIYDHIIMDYHDYNGVIYKFTNLSLLILE